MRTTQFVLLMEAHVGRRGELMYAIGVPVLLCFGSKLAGYPSKDSQRRKPRFW